MIAELNRTLTNEELFVQLYETTFPKVATFIRKMGGSLEESKDIFQDALVIYYEKKSHNELDEENKQAYVFGIAKHLWFKKYRKDKILKPLDLFAEPVMEEKEPKVLADVMLFVERSGKKCLELLKSFYYDKMNMKELAEKFGFSGERSATAQKFKCLEKVREAVKLKSLNKEDFYE